MRGKQKLSRRRPAPAIKTTRTRRTGGEREQKSGQDPHQPKHLSLRDGNSGVDGARSGDAASWGHRGVRAAAAAVVADLPGHGLLRSAARHTVPHQAGHAAMPRLLHGSLPPAGPEPQLQVREAANPCFNRHGISPFGN